MILKLLPEAGEVPTSRPFWTFQVPSTTRQPAGMPPESKFSETCTLPGSAAARVGAAEVGVGARAEAGVATEAVTVAADAASTARAMDARSDRLRSRVDDPGVGPRPVART